MKTDQKISPAEIVADVCRPGYGLDTLQTAASGNDKDREQIVAILLDTAAREADQESRNTKEKTKAIATIYATLFGLFLFCCSLVSEIRNNPFAVAYFLLPAVVCHVLHLLTPPTMDDVKVRCQVGRLLTDIAPDDERTLGVLLDSLPLLHKTPAWECRCTTHSMMASFQPIASLLWKKGDDVSLLLDKTRRKKLRGMLRAFWDTSFWEHDTVRTNFYAAAIKALTLAGDTESIGLLQMMAGVGGSQQVSGKPVKGENKLFIQSLAGDCLPMLAEVNARNESDADQFKRLLYSRDGEINTNDVDRFLNTIGEARANRVVHQALQKYADSKRLDRQVSLLSGICLLFLFFVMPLELDHKIICSVIVLLLFGGRRTPNLTEQLSHVYSGFNSTGKRESVDSKRLKILGYHASESTDSRLLMPLFDAMKASNFEQLKRPFVKMLRNLVAGDIVYVEPRLLSFLRGVISAQFAVDTKPRYDAAFTEAAIYALGILQDEKAHLFLSCISLSDDPKHAPYLGATLDAIRRINDAKAWRGTGKTAKQKKSVRKNRKNSPW